jgi:transcriptional regulator with XRE-family HTH domain
MVIGERLRQLREAKKLSQGDIERLTGLKRCYTSRVECGHTVPTVETLEKYAKAVELPLYKLFCDGDETPRALKLPAVKHTVEWCETSSKERKELRRFAKLLSRLSERQRLVLLNIALWMMKRRVD